MKHLNIKVTGRVQGVSFRYYTREKARELGVFGYVRNMKDGSVYIEAEGKPAQLDTFVAWCEKGPSLARVTAVDIEEGTAAEFSSFEIHR